MGENVPSNFIVIEFEGHPMCKVRCSLPLCEEKVLDCMKSRFPLPSKVLLEVYEPEFTCWCAISDWDSLPSFPRFRATPEKAGIYTQPTINTLGSASTSKVSAEEESLQQSLQLAAVNPDQDTSKSATKNFKFTVPWDDLPLALLVKLRMADVKKEQANPKDIDALKLAIASKCYSAYSAHKLSTGATQRTPGMKVYEDIGEQVHGKFKHCMKIEGNGRVLENGKGRFVQSFKITMENKFRQPEKKKAMMSASMAKGTVGVLRDSYNPPVDDEKESLEGKEMLKKMHERRRSQWNNTSIDRTMHQTYALQRKDIVQAIQKIKDLELNPDEEDLFEDNPPEKGTELENLKEEWPFLFYIEWQGRHFQQLMGETIDRSVREFCTDHLDKVITFLVSQQEIVGNAAIKIVWEKYGRNEKTKFLAFLLMLANYFSEDISSFVRSVEKTTMPCELMYEQSMTGGPCLVALDCNKYLAQQFYCCIDKVVIIQADSSEEAFLGLMQAIFIFDCAYTESLPHTMEYLERVVCGLVSKKSKSGDNVSQVMTATVCKLVKKLKIFTDQLDLLIKREERSLI